MRKRILALFCVCVMLLSFVPFAFASSANQTYISKSTFWSWLAGMGGVPQKMVGYLTRSGCPDSPDGRHHAKSYKHEAKYGYYSCICSYCGHMKDHISGKLKTCESYEQAKALIDAYMDYYK